MKKILTGFIAIIMIAVISARTHVGYADNLAATTSEKQSLRDASNDFYSATLLKQAQKGAESMSNAKPVRVSPAGQGSTPGFQEEADSFWVNTPKGKFQVVIEPSARAARQMIHAERPKFNGGKSLSEVQAQIDQEPKRDPLASIFIRITEDGHLVGAMKSMNSPFQPFQLWSYTLNDEGTTTRVLLSGGKADQKPALFVRPFDSAGRNNSWIILTADNTIQVHTD